MKTEEGSFHISEDGEEDVRAAYCAVSVIKLLQVLSRVCVSACVFAYLRACSCSWL